ncbi:hypothetical protein [Pseudomonas sp. NPDC089741]|uniref:hypothetical protein n=1 Tax=Pseudomonas sp. NPDC089741 TaxID=3364470 RepID=UPI00380B0694
MEISVVGRRSTTDGPNYSAKTPLYNIRIIPAFSGEPHNVAHESALSNIELAITVAFSIVIFDLS